MSRAGNGLGLWPWGLDLRISVLLVRVLARPVRMLRWLRDKLTGGPDPKRVVFVSRVPRAREAKLARALRARGWRVVLIHEMPATFGASDLFDEVHRVGSALGAWRLLAFDRAKIVHVFSQACDLTAYLTVRYAPIPAVFDPTDIIEAHDLRRDDPTRMRVYAWTRLCVAHAAGVCARDLQLQAARRDLGFRRPRRIVFFPEYCWGDDGTPRPADEKGDARPRFVVAGNIGLDPEREADWCYLDVARRLHAQGSELHVFRHWDRRPAADGADPYRHYLDLARQGVGVRVHAGIDARALPLALSRYDAGIVVHEHLLRGVPSTLFDDAIFARLGASRCFDCVDAGIPFVANREFRFWRFLFARWGFHVEAPPNLEGVADRVVDVLHDAALRGLRAKGRAALSVDAHIRRLEAFYAAIDEKNQR